MALKIKSFQDPVRRGFKRIETLVQEFLDQHPDIEIDQTDLHVVGDKLIYVILFEQVGEVDLVLDPTATKSHYDAARKEAMKAAKQSQQKQGFPAGGNGGSQNDLRDDEEELCEGEADEEGKPSSTSFKPGLSINSLFKD